MKLQLLLEVFDKPSMEGVKVRSLDKRRGEFSFTDPSIPDSPRYDVEIYLNPFSPIESFKYFELHNDDLIRGNIYDIETELRPFSGTAEIFLSHHKGDNSSYSKTRLQNQWFVYSKLIACVAEFVKSSKPVFLAFSGATDDMELVYDKFIKLSNRLDPSNSYEHFWSKYYIRKDVKKLIISTLGELNDGEAKRYRAQRLKNIRNAKNYQKEYDRQRAERQAENHGYTDDSDDDDFFNAMFAEPLDLAPINQLPDL